jgi:hypothetical protein
MATSYHSTKDLCERFRCSSRTLFRRMQRQRNPFPQPSIRHAGSFNLWDSGDVAAWELRERERTNAGLRRPGVSAVAGLQEGRS